jgi:DNA polymerase III epsilon subunit-like protein
MNYIVFDLEFNQDFVSLQEAQLAEKQSNLPEEKDTDLCDGPSSSVSMNLQMNKKGLSQYPYEIIQIGAVKLDSNFIAVSDFNRYIKPAIYPKISSLVTELTGITTGQLLTEEPFAEVYSYYLDFIGDPDSVLCIWGMSDIKELIKNAEFYGLNTKQIPRRFINLQPYVTKHFNLPPKKLLRLETSVDMLHIPKTCAFHNAYYDACYTAEIFKRIYNPKIEPKFYHPSQPAVRPRQPKKIINYDRLIHQFEKMYSRSLTEEEQDMIKLAYKMGRTNQFVE